ncbi:two-component sensor histidine kinase [Streptomyces spiroverticillatus]|uniref:sensor histidine kinase n=1 Tax=Streptomyces finlayi TaxID=67296 RepID=UPI001983E7B1|nr:histidine kinase [Streptomyces finlayi]GHA21696.1 two-component sensor histidine kinase [Streptomyces spiroverticillatus]
MFERLKPKPPALLDTALWAALAGAGVFAYGERAAPSPVRDLVLPLLVLAVAVPVSRSRPRTGVLLANAVCALGLASGPVPAGSPYLLALAVLTLRLGTGPTGTRPALVALGGCLAVDLAVCAVLRVDAVYWFYTVSLVPLALLLPWLAGRYLRARAALVRDGWDRAQALEERQRAVAERARLRERERIAADMHDSLGHELSLVALRAGALELSPTLTDTDRADLADLRTAVADAVDHLRDTIGVLRAAAPSPTSPPESVEQLVARARESGAPVTLHRTGTGPSLAPLVDRTVYRVVQEALTNALKHAPGSPVRISVDHRDSRTSVRVTNPAPTPSASPGGHGLTGLRERVRLVGGTFRAGHRDGGYEMLAALPDDVTPPSRPSPPVRENGLAAARRVTRRRFAVAFAAPAALGLVALGSAATLAHQLTGSVLRPADYAALRAGQPRDSFADRLPGQQFAYVPEGVRAAPRPAGTRCEFYRSNGSVLDRADVYRLCFTGPRLAAKDVLPGDG